MTQEDRDDAIDKLIGEIQVAYRAGDYRKLNKLALRLEKLTRS